MAISKIDSDGITAGGITADSLNIGQIGGRRNLIINGAMQVAQRGTSTSGITGSNVFPACDRWRWLSSAEDTVTIEQSTDAPDGFGYSLKVTATTADTSIEASDYAQLTTRLEGQDLQHLNYNTAGAKTVCVSFWVKSSVVGTYSVSAYLPDGTTNRYYGTTYSISSADTWEYKTVAINGNTSEPIDNDNGNGFSLYFTLMAGTDYSSGSVDTWGDVTHYAAGQVANALGTTNATWQITGVQLEVGSVATPFEHRSYGEELALCQRYYQVVNAYTPIAAVGAGAANVRAGYSLSVPLRASPTIYIGTFSLIDRDSDTAKSPSGASVWGTYYTNRTSIGIQHTGVSGITDNRPYVIYQSTDAATRFDAEL